MAFSITNSNGLYGQNSNTSFGDALPNFSISMWIKSASVQNTTVMLSQKWDLANAGWFFFVIPTTGQISFGLNNGAYQKNGTSNFYDGTWHNVIIAYDGSVGVTGYLDGVAITFPAGAGGTPTTNANQLYLGGPSSQTINGQIYDVRFFTLTLSPAGAASIAAGGNTGPVGLGARWPFTESSGTTFASTVGGNTLTYNATPTPFSNTDIPPVFLARKKKASMFLVF